MTIHSYHAQEAVKYLQYMVASMPDVESFREDLAKGQHFLKRAQEDVAEDLKYLTTDIEAPHLDDFPRRM